MANRRLTAAVRELVRAGWRRDLAASSDMLKVWTSREGRLTVVLEPGRPGSRWATIRIIQDLDLADWVTIADCKVGSDMTALRILNAYGIVSDQVVRRG